LVLAALTIAGCEPGARQVSMSGAGAFEVSIARSGDGVAVAWYDTRHGNAELYARLVDAEGRNASGELRLTFTPEESYEADVEALGENLAVAWYEKAGDGTLAAQLGLWSKGGEPRWQLTLPGSQTRNPLVRAHAGALFAAWIEADADGAEQVR